MAQNGPHGHQVVDVTASDDGHSTPPTTVSFSLTGAGPYGSGGSSAGNKETMGAAAGMGRKNLIPDLNIEDRDSMDKSKDKPRWEAEADAVEVPPAADADKGKSVAADDDGELLERERRKRMKDLFSTLQDLMPHVPQKTDKVSLVGEAIQYIKFLEDKAAILGKQKLEQELSRQAAARREASSSSFSPTAMPQTAQGQGMAALCSSDVPRGWGGVPVPLPPAAAAVPAPPIRFKTWMGRNVVLTLAGDSAYISVCAPRRPNALTMVLSILDSHRIDVITLQISSDSARVLFLIFAHMTGIDGDNRSSEEVYQMAMSEIMFRLNSSN